MISTREFVYKMNVIKVITKDGHFVLKHKFSDIKGMSPSRDEDFAGHEEGGRVHCVISEFLTTSVVDSSLLKFEAANRSMEWIMFVIT